jgi:hypothetical protein
VEGSRLVLIETLDLDNVKKLVSTDEKISTRSKVDLNTMRNLDLDWSQQSRPSGLILTYPT